MRFTNSKDNRKRVTIQIETRLSVEDIAEILVADEKHQIYENPDYVKTIAKRSSKDIMTAVKKYILYYGNDDANYVIGDNDLEDYVTELTALLNKKFGV